MKKYLIMALAAFGFAACSDKEFDTNSPIHNGELEESYIAINLMSADLDTRATTDENGGSNFGLENGTTEERTVKSANFFFFKDGAPFNVNKTDAPATAPGGTQNHLALNVESFSFTASEEEGVNVSDISNAVLVLNTYKGDYPNQIVAVLNWTPTVGKAYTLKELREEIYDNSLGNATQGYVMSNSVYMNGANQEVDAVPITIENIQKSETDAKAKPVEIYVERTAAKVALTATGKVDGTTNIFNVQKSFSPVGKDSKAVYMQLLGWELYNDYDKTNLVKNINTSWDPATLGLTWNDIPYFRSYWAASQDNPINDKFAWSYTDDKKTEKGFESAYGFSVGSATYCGENTNGADLRTKVILKGQLVQKNADDTYTTLEVARWYGTEYAGNEDLRKAVVNSLAYTLFYKDNEGVYHNIKEGDITCVAGKNTGDKAYEVGFQLSTQGEGKEWFQYSSASGYQRFGDLSIAGDNEAKANEYLATIEPAILYANGMTYYFVDIKHLGAAGKTAEYGVVRNHVYKIDIQSITGYGSPVVEDKTDIDTPKYPDVTDESSFVAAKINILSWKIVQQGVDIKVN